MKVITQWTRLKECIGLSKSKETKPFKGFEVFKGFDIHYTVHKNSVMFDVYIHGYLDNRNILVMHAQVNKDGSSNWRYEPNLRNTQLVNKIHKIAASYF